MTTIRSLRDCLINPQVIYPGRETHLPCAFVHSNEAEFDPVWAGHIVANAYRERTAISDAVMIGRLPAGAMLRGGDHFLLCVDGAAIADYIPHVFRENTAALGAELKNERAVIEIREEFVLLARYGHGTWGHWMGEILPIAAAVEAAYPGRFRYAVPQSGHVDYVTGMIQSLALYGISIQRLVWLRSGFDHRFHRALAVTPIWSDSAPHPAALDALRKVIPNDPQGPKKIALMRRDSLTRAIANAAEVQDVLVGEGFYITDMAGVRFAQQLRAFSGADVVFGVLGSGLTGLIYSPDYIRVIAASPSGFSDRFFYALVQRRGGRWVEVKGRSLWNGRDGLLRDAPFEIPIRALREALAAIAG